MKNLQKGIASGFCATMILSMAMYVKAHLSPHPQVISALTLISHRVIDSPSWIWIGWAYHFVIGTFLWGILFSFVAAAVRPRRPLATWATGTGFAVGAWVLMLVIVMPLAGAGFFARKAGVDLLYATLILHVIWGTVLGLVFFALSAPSQSVPRLVQQG